MIINGDKIPKLLSISVMAHPSREQFFPYLRDRLGDVPFSIDEKSEGVWPNCRRAWQLHDPESLYHVVIQDDAIVCDQFQERAEESIYDMLRRGYNGHALSFYFGSRDNIRTEAKKALDRGYATRVRPSWGVAICLQSGWIQEMLEWTEKCSSWRDDHRIGMFLAHKNIRTYFPMPSLVDHRLAAETPSLVGDPGRGRRAYKFIDADETYP